MSEEQFVKIRREHLYNEIWELSASGVAKKYNIPYTQVLKICKEFNVPIPPSGYWTKVSFGKATEKIALPESHLNEVVFQHSPLKVDSVIQVKEDSTREIEIKTSKPSNESTKEQKILTFLLDGERQKILEKSNQLSISDENTKLHKKIRAYQQIVKEWNENDKKSPGAERNYKAYTNQPPFLAGVISKEALPRVYKILDVIYRKIEELGGSVNEDLSLQIRGERVTLSISEYQDTLKHVLTPKEEKELAAYEDARRHKKWASKPNMRKYDYAFNGNLRIGVRQNKYFRDSDKEKLESRLEDLIIEIYEESEELRIKQELVEAAKRKEEEDRRKFEDYKVRYNEEIDKTSKLINMAEDYAIACKIRNFISALESSPMETDANNVEFIEWSKRKADWFDPTIIREDELFGKRIHEKDKNEKELKKRGIYWR
ncbi:MAG: hypothetical protein ACRCSG_09735 [Cellulosilyticaceae bacterium]